MMLSDLSNMVRMFIQQVWIKVFVFGLLAENPGAWECSLVIVKVFIVLMLTEMLSSQDQEIILLRYMTSSINYMTCRGGHGKILVTCVIDIFLSETQLSDCQKVEIPVL